MYACIVLHLHLLHSYLQFNKYTYIRTFVYVSSLIPAVLRFKIFSEFHFLTLMEETQRGNSWSIGYHNEPKEASECAHLLRVDLLTPRFSQNCVTPPE